MDDPGIIRSNCGITIGLELRPYCPGIFLVTLGRVRWTAVRLCMAVPRDTFGIFDRVSVKDEWTFEMPVIKDEQRHYQRITLSDLRNVSGPLPNQYGFKLHVRGFDHRFDVRTIAGNETGDYSQIIFKSGGHGYAGLVHMKIQRASHKFEHIMLALGFDHWFNITCILIRSLTRKD